MLSLINKKEEKNEKYWSILIEDDWVSSAIWEIDNGQVKVVSSSDSIKINDNLVQAIDTTLSVCVQKLGDEDLEPEKTVFGVPLSWTQDGQIKPEFLERLKKVCEDLSLTPSGFVILPEAIAHFIKTEDQVVFNGALLGIGENSLNLSLFSQGVMSKSTHIARSVSVSEDLIEGLSRFNLEKSDLPTRIMLFNQKETELEDIKSELTENDWVNQEGVQFMHSPKVEIFKPEDKLLAVCLAGGAEIGGVDSIVKGEDDYFNTDEDSNVVHSNELTAKDLGFEVSSPQVEQVAKVEPVVTSNVRKFEMPKVKVPRLNLPKFNLMGSGRPMIVATSVLAAFIVAAVLFWWFYPTATATIYLSPKKVDDSLTLTLGDEIKTREVEVNLSGEKSKSTTGTKTTGEKAKGSVEVRNSTGFNVNLPSGTAILSTTNLKFVTTEASSVSAQVLVGSPGKASVPIEASTIGSEYNLSKDEVFKVGSYPQYEVAAFANENFEGGTSRQISAVSDKDLKDIFSELESELKAEAVKKLEQEISEDEVVIGSMSDYEVVDENYSNKLGDEASNIKLNLNLTFKTLVVKKDDLVKMSRSKLESKVPSGFTLTDNNLEYEFELLDEESIRINLVANLLPQVDADEIKKNIAGKTIFGAESYLESLSGFVNAKFDKKLIPAKNETLPQNKKNIKIIFAAYK